MIILSANIEPVFIVNDGAVTLTHRTTATTTPDSEMLDFYPELSFLDDDFVDPIDLDALDKEGNENDA